MTFGLPYFRRSTIGATALFGLYLSFSAYATDIVATATAPAPSKAHISKATSVKEKLDWHDLTPVQQKILAPLASEWNGLSAFRKKKWLELAVHYNAMEPGAQARMQTRIEDWAKLSPEQRRKARQSYINAKKLTPEQKATRWEDYQQLPEEKKEKLAAAAPIKKSIVNPPLIHHKKASATKKPTVPTSSAPIAIEHPPVVPTQPDHKNEPSTETDSDSAF